MGCLGIVVWAIIVGVLPVLHLINHASVWFSGLVFLINQVNPFYLIETLKGRALAIVLKKIYLGNCITILNSNMVYLSKLI